jgi:hypothetical protein
MSDHTFWTIAFGVWLYASAAMLLGPFVYHRSGRRLGRTIVVTALWLPLYGLAYLWLAAARVTGRQR